MDVPEAVWSGLQRLAVLPDWLASATHPERIQRALTGAIPAVASGSYILHSCDCGRPRLKSGTWTFSCQVTLGTPEGDRKEMQLEGSLYHGGPPLFAHDGPPVAFGSEEWHCLVPELGLEFRSAPADSSLPMLPDLVDADKARVLLETAIRTAAPGYADLRIAQCQPKVTRYESGNRCTIVYQLGYGPEAAGRGWPELVVAKTYGGKKGQTAYDGMRALWNSELAGSTAVTIAEPLAYWPDQRVLVQGPIREDLTLKELIRSSLGQGTPEALDQLDEYMAKTAAGLAALHRCGVRQGATATWDDQVAEIRGLMERLAVPIPEIAGAVEPLLNWLVGLDARNPAQPVAPAHGTFRPAQVLLHEGEIGFIDFDGFCQAEPALDVALFRAGIKDIGAGSQPPAGAAGVTSSNPQAIGITPSALEVLAEAFLRHYEAVAPVSRERVMLWEALHLLVYVLHAWTKVSAKRLPSRMAILREHLLSSGLPA
jgi:hypothetical protein